MIKPALLDLIRRFADKLNCPPGIDPARLLMTIALNESSGGFNIGPRFERSYAPGGKYHKRSAQVQVNYKAHGALASCSYGSFQILYQTAYELGFRGYPMRLAYEGNVDIGLVPNDVVGIGFVIELLNRRILHKNPNLLQIADAYNSGSFEDEIIPEEYKKDFAANYEVANQLLKQL